MTLLTSDGKDSRLTPSWGSHGRFRTMSVQFGGVPKIELIERVKVVRSLSPYAESMILHDGFTVLEAPKIAILADISPADRGFKKPPTTDELFGVQRLADWSAENAASLNGYIVDLSPAEVIPPFAIQYKNQPNGEVIWIAMKLIPIQDGGTGIFVVRCNNEGKLWLYHERDAHPKDRWKLDSHMLYRLSEGSQAPA